MEDLDYGVNLTEGSGNDSTNTILPEIGDNGVNKAYVTLAWCAAVWTIATNFVLVLILLCKSREKWPNFARLVLSLSICDLAVGISCLPILISVTSVHSSVSDYFPCMLTFFLYFLSQLASLYHVTGICFHRSLTRRTTITQHRGRDKIFPFVLSSLSWVVSCIICFVPFYLWTDKDKPIKYCSFDNLFTNSKHAAGILAIFYIIPQILTDIFYMIAVFRTRFLWRRVASVTSGTNGPSTNANPFSRTQVRIQREVLGTIGVVMLLFNLCTIPIVVVMLKQNRIDVQKRDHRFIASTLFVLNSAINPLVYAFGNKWLRYSIRDTLKDCFQLCCGCFLQSAESVTSRPSPTS